jgi:protein TonB
MNFALSQRPADRHPLGLLVVTGLHVVLAGVLLSARLKSPPAEPPPVALTPLAPVRPTLPAHVEVEPRRPVLPQRIVLPPPPVEIDPPPATITGRVETTPDTVPPPTIVASVGSDNAGHEPARFTPRAAQVDVGAAGCRPGYPAAAQRAGVAGITRIRFTVDASGRIAGAQILRPSGSLRENHLLDKAAAEALAQCPVRVGTDERGRPVGTTTDVDYVWTLD